MYEAYLVSGLHGAIKLHDHLSAFFYLFLTSQFSNIILCTYAQAYIWNTDSPGSAVATLGPQVNAFHLLGTTFLLLK